LLVDSLIKLFEIFLRWKAHVVATRVRPLDCLCDHGSFELSSPVAVVGNFAGLLTLQELVDKSFQIKKSWCTSSWH